MLKRLNQVLNRSKFKVAVVLVGYLDFDLVYAELKNLCAVHSLDKHVFTYQGIYVHRSLDFERGFYGGLGK